MKRLVVLAAGLALAACAGEAKAQEQAIVLPEAPPIVTSDDDDFSSSRLGQVRYGPYASSAYSRIELSFLVHASSEETLYALQVSLSSMDPRGDITSVAARGGVEFPALFQGSVGRVNCSGSRYSRGCRSSYSRTFEIPDSILVRVRGGESVDVRVRSTEGAASDILITVTPAVLAALDTWLAR